MCLPGSSSTSRTGPGFWRRWDRIPTWRQGRDGDFGWYEATDADGMRRSLGSFVLEDNRLVFEAMSEARAARGRGFLEGLAAAP